MVAVSGGPDSMALLHVLKTLQDDYKLELLVAHFNHQLRGQEAWEDALFVENFAKKLHLPCQIGSADVLAYVKKHGLSVEEGARQLRYEFLFNLLKTWPGTKIAVGHHEDDQAETVLLHLIRGSGLQGLAGMSPKREQIIRPLLGVSRKEIECYCQENNLPTRIDASNFETIYTRNKIRRELLPLLKEFNPKIVQNLNAMAQILRAENEFLAARAQEAFQKIARVSSSEVILDKKEFNQLHLALKRRILRLAYGRLAQEGDSLNFRFVNMAEEFIREEPAGKKLGLPGGIVLLTGPDTIIFNKPISQPGLMPYELSLSVPGAVTLPQGISLEAKEVKLAEARQKYKQASPHEAYLDLEKIVLPLVVRSRRQGDVFHPLGMSGQKKLKDFFIDLKVPRHKRDWIPVITDGTGRIIWVGGYRIDDNFKVTEETKRILYLKLGKKEEG